MSDNRHPDYVSPLHPNGKCTCAGEERCNWHWMIVVKAELGFSEPNDVRKLVDAAREVLRLNAPRLRAYKAKGIGQGDIEANEKLRKAIPPAPGADS